jgi:transposase
VRTLAAKGKAALEQIQGRACHPHVKQRREEAAAQRSEPGFRARRRVVERTHSWVNRFRKVLASFEKSEPSFPGLLALACALICWRQTIFSYG